MAAGPPPPLGKGNYMLYCMGEGYFNKKAYDKDNAFVQAQVRTNQDVQQQFVRTSMFAQELRQAQQQANNAPRLPLPQPIQNFINTVLVRPAAFVINFAQTVANRAQQFVMQLPQLAQELMRNNNLLSRMLSFFYTTKKSTGQNDEQDIEDRQKNDENMPTDLFGMDMSIQQKTTKTVGQTFGAQV